MSQVKEATAKTKRGRYSWLGFSLAALVGGIVVLLVWQARSEKTTAAPAPIPADPVVATINAETVSTGEYRLVMERKVPLVFSYFKEHQNMDDHLGYWSENTGPESPLAKLREMTREELVRIKVYQGLAKDKGLIKETTFASFQAEFERENVRRSAARLAGQVIYGPPQYRLTSYYYIRFGDLVYKLKQALMKEAESGITESEVQKFYKENKAAFGDESQADARQAILTALSSREAERELDRLCASAKVEMYETMVRPLVPRVDPEPGNPNKLTVGQQ